MSNAVVAKEQIILSRDGYEAFLQKPLVGDIYCTNSGYELVDSSLLEDWVSLGLSHVQLLIEDVGSGISVDMDELTLTAYSLIHAMGEVNARRAALGEPTMSAPVLLQ